MDVKPSHRWYILSCCVFMLFSMGVCYLGFPPICDALAKEMPLSDFRRGFLMDVYAIPGIFFSVPAAIFMSKYGLKRVCFIGFFIMMLGLLLSAMAPNYQLLIVGRMLCGVGNTLLAIAMPQMMSEWFIGYEISFAMGVSNVAFPLGVTVSFLFFPELSEQYGWRFVPWLGLVLICFSALIFWLWFKPKHADKAAEAMQFKAALKRCSQLLPLVWIPAVVWLLFNAIIISFQTHAKNYLQILPLASDSGAFLYSKTEASSLVSYVYGVSLLLSPFGGWWLDRFKKHTATITGGFLAMAILIAIMPLFVGHEWYPILGLGVVVAILPPALFALPVNWFERQDLALFFGMISMAAAIGGSSTPGLIGWLIDTTGFTVLFVVLSALCVVGVVIGVMFGRALPGLESNKSS